MPRKQRLRFQLRWKEIIAAALCLETSLHVEICELCISQRVAKCLLAHQLGMLKRPLILLTSYQKREMAAHTCLLSKLNRTQCFMVQWRRVLRSGSTALWPCGLEITGARPRKVELSLLRCGRLK
jgi:hypothetical protein